MRSASLSNRQIYHIYNRGVDKRNIFLNTKDYQRFSDSLFVFNNTENLNGRRFTTLLRDKGNDSLVNVIAYCLMPNHFHLLLEQLTDNGITKFLQKMTTSYTMYFNKKYSRTGALIQGVFKRSHIKSNGRLLEMSRYIHRNPIKILTGENSASLSLKKELLTYQWSSLPDYAGVSIEPKIISNKELIIDQFKSPEAYVAFVLGET